MDTAAPAAPAAAPSSSPASAPAASPAPSSTPSTPAPASATPTPGDGQPAAAPPAPAPKVYRRKINGRDVEVPATISIEEAAKLYGMTADDYLRGPDLMRAAYAKFEEASKTRKEAEAREAAWKKRYEDPRITALRQQDPSMTEEDAWALVKTQELYERSQQTPEQRAFADERRRREELEAKLKGQEESQKKAQAEAETKAYAGQFEKQIISALNETKLPRNPLVGRMIIEKMQTMAKAGAIPDAKAAAASVAASLRVDTQSMLTAMEPAALTAFLGPQVVQAILQHEVAKARGNGAQPPKPPPVPEPTKPEAPRFLSVDEWRAQYR
jgi:hypothetical protein